jgi:hypothetical protein
LKNLFRQKPITSLYRQIIDIFVLNLKRLIMTFNKPFHRNYRPLKKSPNSGYSSWAYIVDHSYSDNPEYYTRAFSIIQEDIVKLFEFVEPSDTNNSTYSFRIHELLTRICIEVEANFKAILRENIFNPLDRNGAIRQENSWKITDFAIVNKTHHLDDYSIQLPFWKGSTNIRKPFYEWKQNKPLPWYQAYNKSKHDRVHNFEVANFSNLIDAYAGLCVLLSSQFRTEDFKPGSQSLGANTDSYFGGGFGIGNFLIVDWPDDWQDAELYDFDWSNLKNESIRFNKINYDTII